MFPYNALDLRALKIIFTGAEDDTRLSASPDIKIELYSSLKEVLDIAHKIENAQPEAVKRTIWKRKTHKWQQ